MGTAAALMHLGVPKDTIYTRKSIGLFLSGF